MEAKPFSSWPALPRFGRERQDRKQLPQGLVNDDFLPHLRQDFTHRLEVKASAGDLGRLDIFLKNGAKSRDITLGLIGVLLSIAAAN